MLSSPSRTRVTCGAAPPVWLAPLLWRPPADSRPSRTQPGACWGCALQQPGRDPTPQPGTHRAPYAPARHTPYSLAASDGSNCRPFCLAIVAAKSAFHFFRLRSGRGVRRQLLVGNTAQQSARQGCRQRRGIARLHAAAGTGIAQLGIELCGSHVSRREWAGSRDQASWQQSAGTAAQQPRPPSLCIASPRQVERQEADTNEDIKNRQLHSKRGRAGSGLPALLTQASLRRRHRPGTPGL